MPTDAPPPAGGPGLFAFDGLDRVLHEKARLGILTSLLSHRDGLVFNQLRDLCADRRQPQPAPDDACKRRGSSRSGRA